MNSLFCDWAPHNNLIEILWVDTDSGVAKIKTAKYKWYMSLNYYRAVSDQKVFIFSKYIYYTQSTGLHLL